MAQMTVRHFTAGLLAAALAFRQQEEAEVEKARVSTALNTGEDAVTEEQDEEALWEKFQGFVSDNGVTLNPGSEMVCIAGLNAGEPSFTLRGQDILASMLVRHWVALYEGLAPETVESKIVEAEGIAEKMELYNNQLWAD